jgi:hypothetical protein
MSQIKYVVVCSSEEDPIREGFDTRAEAEARIADLGEREDGERYAVAEMPTSEWDEFDRCGNRSATFSVAELKARGVI